MLSTFPLLQEMTVPQFIKKGLKNQTDFEILILKFVYSCYSAFHVPKSTLHILKKDLPQRVSYVQNILEVMEELKLGVKPVILRWSGGCI